MMRKAFVFINMPMALSLNEIPPSDHLSRLASTAENTEIEFLINVGFLKQEAECRNSPREQAIVSSDDLTEEGYDFLMSKEMAKWLQSCDRKSSVLSAKGASFEEQLKVYADPRGLYSRLEKFRKQRATEAH
jgi:hypothetical protein